MKKNIKTVFFTALMILNFILMAGGAPPPSSGGGGGGGGDNVPPPRPANLIGPGGGELTTNGYRIVIPGGALSADTAIVINPLSESNLPGMMPAAAERLIAGAQFVPDNTRFNKNVDIVIPLETPLTVGDSYGVFVYNKERDRWDFYNTATVGTDGKSISFTLTHFSVYAIFVTLPPVISNINPAENAVNIPVNTNVFFKIESNGIDVALDSLSVELAGETAVFNGVLQPGYGGSITGDTSGGYTVLIDSDVDFDYEQVVDVTINVSDITGSAINPKSYSFTCLADTSAPTVVNQNPVPNGTGIAADTNIYFEIDEAEYGVDLSTLQVTINNDNAIINGVIRGAAYSG